jgi:hypothetical protein
MAFTGNNDLIEIVKRNRLRAEAGLPLLICGDGKCVGCKQPAIKPRWNATTRNSPSVDRQQSGWLTNWADGLLPANRCEKRCESAEFEARQPYRLDTQSACSLKDIVSGTIRGTSMGEELTFTMMT